MLVLARRILHDARAEERADVIRVSPRPLTPLCPMQAHTGAATATWGHSVRMDNYKGVSFALGAPMALYDLSVDIGELHDLAAAHPDVIAAMEAFAAEAHVNNSYFPQVNCVGS